MIELSLLDSINIIMQPLQLCIGFICDYHNGMKLLTLNLFITGVKCAFLNMYPTSSPSWDVLYSVAFNYYES